MAQGLTPARPFVSFLSDYGHTDASSEVDAIDIFRASDLVTDPVKKKILDDNPRALYAL